MLDLAPERHGHDVGIALFAAHLGGLFVGLPLALTAGRLASRNGAGTEPKRLHWT